MQEDINIPLSNKTEGYRSLFRNKNFLFLWLGQVFSQLGDRVTFVIFVAVIASIFSTSTSLQSWLYVAFTIPAILLTAVAGVFIDRWNKKYTLIATNILRALLIIFLPLFSKALLGIYFLAFCVSAVTQFFVPAEASSIPMLVNKNQLISANSLFTTTMMGSVIIGFVLGDPLINIFGLKAVHWAVAGLFIISALCLTFIKYKPANELSHDNKTVFDFFNELKQGFTYIKENSKVLQAILKLALLFSIIVMLSILSIGISQQKLYPENPALGAQKFAYIIAFSGIGMVIGALLVGKLWRNASKYFLIYSGFTIIAICLILLAIVDLIPYNLHISVSGWDYWKIHFEAFRLTFRMLYSYFVAGIIGFGCALVAIPVQTIIHSSVPEEMRGKVFGVQFTLLSTSSTLPVLVAALGADVIGITNILIVIALPVFVLGIYGLIKVRSKLISK
jgi:MFS family permease